VAALGALSVIQAALAVAAADVGSVGGLVLMLILVIRFGRWYRSII